MIRLSKLKAEDETWLVFDVRPRNIAQERGVPVKVYLGRIAPGPEDSYFRWESAWGASSGREASLEAAQIMIETCAKGMYE
jgi:hypothetical protein